MQKIEKITPQIAALYLGAKCQNSNGTIYTVSNTDIPALCYDAEPWRKLTLHLRRLDSITEEEAREIYEISKGEPWLARTEWMDEDDEDRTALRYYWNNTDEWYTDEKNMEIGRPLVWLWLLSKGFDLFGLIDCGLAIEIK